MDGHRKGYLFALLATISVSFNYIFSKYALKFLDPLTFCIVWFAAGSVYALAFALYRIGGRGLRLERQNIWPAGAIGFFSAISVFATFTAVKLLDPTVASLFARMDLGFVLLIGAACLGERFNMREAGGLAIAAIGIFVMNWQSPPEVWSGFLWMMLACMTFAISSAICKHRIHEITPEALTFYRAFLVTLFLVVYSAGTLHIGNLPAAHRTGVLVAVIGTFFGPFLNHLFLFHSMRYVDVSKSVVVRQATPAFVAMWSLLFLHMVPTARQALGGLVIVLGIAILILGGKTREPPQDGESRLSHITR